MVKTTWVLGTGISLLLQIASILYLPSLCECHQIRYKSMDPAALMSNHHFHSRSGRCFFGGGDSDDSVGGYDSESRPETQITIYRNRPVRNELSNTQPNNFLHKFRSLSGTSSQLSSSAYKLYPYAVAIPYPHS